MNVLFVGHGNGSWIMRGHQIGRALGARVTSTPTEPDWRWADVVILVKHAAKAWAPFAHRFDVPIVWDVLDVWRQPEENHWTVEQGKAFIAGLAATIKPVAMIAATQQMATDIGGVYIPHHCRIGLKPTPPRERVQTVAYDGQKKYLGRWFNAIQSECDRRGWSFVINPQDLTQADILVAFRDGKWDGPLCRRWKSGVKYVNALCAGRPIITQPCAAADEIWPYDYGRPRIDEMTRIVDAFDWLAETRKRASLWPVARNAATKYTVESVVADHYRPLLERVAAGVCA